MRNPPNVVAVAISVVLQELLNAFRCSLINIKIHFFSTSSRSERHATRISHLGIAVLDYIPKLCPLFPQVGFRIRHGILSEIGPRENLSSDLPHLGHVCPIVRRVLMRIDAQFENSARRQLE